MGLGDFKLEGEPHDFVRCRECGNKYKTIEHSHLKTHDMSIEDYEEKYPDAERVSTETLAKLLPQRFDQFKERIHDSEQFLDKMEDRVK